MPIGDSEIEELRGQSIGLGDPRVTQKDGVLGRVGIITSHESNFLMSYGQ